MFANNNGYYKKEYVIALCSLRQRHVCSSKSKFRNFELHVEHK
jgi:hypothetical protein